MTAMARQRLTMPMPMRALNRPFLKTINENFDMNIQDFVTVNFSQLAEIIDYLGGINIAVTEEERQVSNRLIQELGVQCDPITESGESVHLTGDQAVIFARNSDTGGDSERTGRQRGAVRDVFLHQAKEIDVTQYPGLINMVLSQSVTSLSDNDMLGIGTWAVTSGATMEQLSLPNENCNASGEMIDGVWYYVYDLDWRQICCTTLFTRRILRIQWAEFIRRDG